MNLHTQSQLTAALVERVDLLETCVMLKDTVINLSSVISTLSEDANSLRKKIAHLEICLDFTQVNQLRQELTSIQLRVHVDEQLDVQLPTDRSCDRQGLQTCRLRSVEPLTYPY